MDRQFAALADENIRIHPVRYYLLLPVGPHVGHVVPAAQRDDAARHSLLGDPLNDPHDAIV